MGKNNRKQNEMHREDAWVPLEALQRALQRWWWIVLLMLLGGAAGEVIHRIQPPLYESQAAFSFGIDFARTGALTDIEEDYALGVAGDVLNGDAVLQGVQQRAAQSGLALDAAALRPMLFAERRNNVWLLRVRSEDARKARQVAQLWADEAQAQLEQAYQHAAQVDALQRYQDSLVGCLQNSVATEPAHAVCNLGNLAAIQQEIEQTGQALKTEKAASRGLFSALTFERSQEPALAAAPRGTQRPVLILAGALVGFLLSLWLVQIPGRHGR